MDEMRDLLVDEAVGLLYEAALTPSLLQDALGAICRLINGDTSHLVGWTRDSGLPCISISTGLNDEVGPDYAAHYAEIDPRRRLAMTMPPATVLACHEHFDRRFVSHNEYYQDYMLPKVGVHYLLGVGDLIPEDRQLLILGFHRHVGHEHFSEVEKRTLMRFLPHLQRVLRIQAKQAAARDAAVVGDAAGQLTHLGVLALSESGRLLAANPRGEALLREGNVLTLRHGILAATTPDAQATLRTRLLRAATGQVGHLALASPDGTRRYFMSLTPAPRHGDPLVFPSRPSVLALITDNSPRRVATVAQLMGLFGLTPAEARLVRALCLGESVESYGAQEGLKPTTVRTHLRSAMAKTGAGKQKDLVSPVLNLPAVRS